MAEAPGSGRRSLYKAVGSPRWKDAFRQVGVGSGEPWLGCRHCPDPPGQPPCRGPERQVPERRAQWTGSGTGRGPG